ncbi:MAG: hypothetical protein K6A42_05355 [Treponema sp.]|nr:hypothetical protein [Treponema sp.]
MAVKFSRKSAAPFVYLLQKIFFRMTLFSFLLFLSLTLLYVAGNFQGFLDATQTRILRSLIYISITLLFFAVLSIASSLLDTFLSKYISKKKIISMGFYIFSLLLSVTAIVAARTVLVLASGA